MMALPYLPSEHIVEMFRRLRQKAETHSLMSESSSRKNPEMCLWTKSSPGNTFYSINDEIVYAKLGTLIYTGIARKAENVKW